MGMGKFRIGYLRFTCLCWEYAGSWSGRLGQSDRRYLSSYLAQRRDHADIRLRHKSTSALVVQ
jgi:hypothetical protein